MEKLILTDRHLKVLSILEQGGVVSSVLTEDGIEYDIEDWEQVGSYLYPQTFEFLNENGLIECYLEPTPYCKMYTVSSKGLAYL